MASTPSTETGYTLLTSSRLLVVRENASRDLKVLRDVIDVYQDGVRVEREVM